MRAAPLPLTRDLVLIGGGHAHALLLRAWGMDPMPGARLTLVNPGPTAPYTGMLPGFVAGHYTREMLDIDLVRLARFAGARLILGRATAIDRAARAITIEDAILGTREIGYDVACLDIGIHSDMPALPGFAEHGLAAKPLGRLAEGWTRHLDRLRASPDLADGGMAVIGGGVGGVELAMAMAHGARAAAGRPAPLTIIETNVALGGVEAAPRRKLLGRLPDHGITLVEGAEAIRVTAETVALSDGRAVPARLVTGAAGARAHGWLTGTGLDLTDGYVSVDAHLRSVSDPAIFAAGDCAHLTRAPRPKAGVFAVRQAPILNANLRAALGAGRLRRYRPQKRYLKLISAGGKSAIADRGILSAEGAWVWRWKDRIDRRFMRRLDDLPAMAQPPVPKNAAHGMREALGDKPPCGGCGAKVGPAALARVIADGGPPDPRIEIGLGDDAAILRAGPVRLALTTDHLRPVVLDPRLMTRIALNHALSDSLAMGAAPEAVLVQLTLPRLSPRLEERFLGEIMTEIRAVLGGIGTALAGGHTSTGPELQIGFTVIGAAPDRAITLSGARPGDRLVLTRPIGSGTLAAAEMALRARGVDAAAAWAAMARPQENAAGRLKAANAATDVTGFGLAGHLMAMMRASERSALVDLDAVPMLSGAEALARAGIRSTAYAANRAALPQLTVPDDPRAALLFDPQTAGGFLAAVPLASVRGMLRALADEGAPAQVIGEVCPGPPAIHIV